MAPASLRGTFRNSVFDDPPSLAAKNLPGVGNIALACTCVAGRQPQHHTIVYASVGIEHLARRIDRLEYREVLLVGAAPAKAHEREVSCSRNFPLLVGAHPVLKERRQLDCVSDAILYCKSPLATQGHPKLESTKATSESRTVVGQAVRVVLGAQILRNETKGPAERLRTTRPERRAV